MNKKIITGIVTAGLILGGALMVGASQNDDKNVTNSSEQLDSVVINTGEENVAQKEVTANEDDAAKTEQSQQEDQVEKNNKDDKKQEPVITKEEAIQIAESQTGAKVIEIELDEDDNRLFYEIELIGDRFEVEMEIDAATGTIVELDYDDEDDYNDDRL